MIRLKATHLFLLPLFGLALCLSSALSHAQETVNIRSGNHADYSRLVMEWSKVPTYQVSKDAGALTVTFGAQANVNTAGLDTNQTKNIGGVSVASAADAPLALTVQIPADSKFRDFKIGKRIIVDVYNGTGQINRTASNVPQETPSETPSVETPDNQHSALNESFNEAASNAGSLSEQAKKEMPAMPVVSVDQAPIVGAEPHVITLSSTRNVGMAVFERAGYLWVVVDDLNLKVPPSIVGPNAKKFPNFEKVDARGGIAYRLRQPEGFNYYGEGGGLLWRIVVTPNSRKTKPIRGETIYNSDLSYGSLRWALQNTGRVISVIDPVVGDEIQVIAVTDSSQFSGDARAYVEVDTLNSFIGLALVPKSDELKITATGSSVQLDQPQGLAISPSSDTAPIELRSEVTQEAQAVGVDDYDDSKPRALSKIFNFKQWEMGGPASLEQNKRVLMIGIGNKEGGEKVEDLLTIAKLNLANGLGNETLGVLRVARSELPGIEETPEFMALRGAAEVIAGKFDFAIKDLSAPALQKYEEIKYWRAMALAGLEDWQQANKELPSSFGLLSEYPAQVRNPLILSLSEILLRSARLDEAEGLLMLMDPEENKRLSLSRKSAWSYLMGELYRQYGEDDKAIKNWKGLVRGRDDYYRAKAGLSLTKLQLEEQKITPEKAVDLLEGLRYVWRGDELETLVNYRLGEVYIGNNEYVKGLTVLREAASMSPDAPMTKEVTTYMTKTFKELFSEEKIKQVSPLDSLNVYEEFKELTPAGQEGDKFVLKLAERLADVNLLGRASALLEYQLDSRLKGEDAVIGAIRLAAIKLLDNKPEEALGALDIANRAVLQVPKTVDASSEVRQIKLLRARALSKSNQTKEALDVLSGLSEGEDVLRLRADIAWDGRRWAQAAQAFASLIQRAKVSTTTPISEFESGLVLNRAVALNLAGDRVSLDNWRKKYNDVMMKSEKAQLFDLITRPRKLGVLSNKEAISSLVAEVDMFGDFLQSYKKQN